MENEGRRQWTTEQKRQIVEETLKPDTSVSLVARAHDINANQLFYWRRLYRQGLLRDEQPKGVSLLPVKISGALAERRQTRSTTTTSGIIDIDLGHARVRVEGSADPDCVRAALEGLVR